MAAEDTAKAVRSDIPAGRIALVGASLGAMVVVAVLVALAIMKGWQLPMVQPRPPVPDPDGPVQESSAQPALAEYLARKHQQLDGLGWVDKERGLAHVPIEVAMGMVASGVTASAPAAATSTASPTSLPQTSRAASATATASAPNAATASKIGAAP